VLTHAGFRRSQSILYRPACELCSACKSARIRIADFKPSKSQSRVLRKNRDLVGIVKPPEATPHQYALLTEYLDKRHGDGDMVGMDFFDYAGMVEKGALGSEIIEYRTTEDKMLACVLVDRLNDGYSLVYSFFDPIYASRSLGNFIILDHIRRARAQGLDFVYLGYWVKDSPKMAYKANFGPIEILEPAGWRELTDIDLETDSHIRFDAS
jgi:arginine-tRNA-protein transferase